MPVPQAVYEPRLLYEEVIDPEFQATLDRVLLARAGALGARQGLRAKFSELVRLATGSAAPVAPPEQDAQALESESLAPWGPRRAAAVIAGCWRRPASAPLRQRDVNNFGLGRSESVCVGLSRS